MAFGDSLRGNEADVVLRAETGQFNAEIEQAERQWRESISSMSKEALKLDLAQDRLKNSLAKYGAESAQAKRATIALKEAEEAAARSANRATRETNDLARATGRLRVGNVSLTRSVAGLAGAYIGVYGLVSGIRSVVEAAKEEELVHGQTRIALESLGISYDEHERKIERVTRAISQLGFDDEELIKSFQTLVRATGDVDTALERVALAAGVARGRYEDLAFGTQVVNKAQLGMIGTIRRLGIDIDKNATATEALARLQALYGQSAEDASETATAASERLVVEWENMQEVVGRGLLPIITDLSDRLADYFGDAENQEELQRKVNAALETGEDVVRGFAGAMAVLRDVTKPVVDALGGTENAVKALIIAMAIGKVIAFAGSLRQVGTNARFATVNLLAMAAASNAPVGRGIPLGRGFGPPGVGLSPVGVALTALGIGGFLGYKSGQQDAIDAGEMQKLRQAAASGRLGMAELEQLSGALTPAQERELRALINARGVSFPDREDRAAAAKAGAVPASGGGGGGGGGAGGPTLADLELDLAREEARGGDTRDELRALRSFFARQIRVLESKKRLTAAQKERLRSLYGDIANVQSQLDAIEAEEDAKLDEQRRQAQERRERARERERRRMERIMDAATKTAERRRELFEGMGGRWDTRAGLRALALRHEGAAKKLRDQAKTERQLTLEEIRRLHFNFVTGLQGVNNQFGSNYADTQLWTQTQLMQENNRITMKLAGSVAHPGSKYTRNEMMASLGGVGLL